MDIGHLNNNSSIIDTNNETLDDVNETPNNGNETPNNGNETPNNGNETSDNDNTILGNLVNELVNMFFDSILKKDKYGEKNFNPKIKEEFKKNFKTNFNDFTEEKIKKAVEEEKTEIEKKEKETNIGKAMLAFSAMFDEGGIEDYEEKLAKKELSKRLEKVFFSEKGALEYCNTHGDDKNDEIIKAIKYNDANSFVKYNKENCKIEDDKIVVKEGKDEKQSLLRDTNPKIPPLEGNEYFDTKKIKEYLEKNDPKLKKFIETRELILSGNNEIINKFLKEYDKIQNSKYAKKIKEYQKNYSEKKKRAEEITKLNDENNGKIETIKTNEKAIEKVKKLIGEINNKIDFLTKNINTEKEKLKELSFYERIFGKKAKVIKQNIKTNKFCIKEIQEIKKQSKQEIKKTKKINENLKKEICKSVKEINKNYHTGKVELKYKDLKGKESSEIGYEEKVSKAINYANEILKDEYKKGKHFKELQEAQKKFQKEYRKNISSSKKIEKAIIENKANNMIDIDDFSKPLKDLREITKNSTKKIGANHLKNEPLKDLKGITKDPAIKNNAIIPDVKKEQKNTLNQ